MHPIGTPPPLPEASGAAAAPIVETGPKRPWDPAKWSLGNLLKQIGRELGGPITPPRGASPASSESSGGGEHPSVILQLVEDEWVRQPTPDAPATEDDEKEAFVSLNKGDVINTGHHNQQGWIVWQTYVPVENGGQGPEVTFLFTQGGEDPGRGNEDKMPDGTPIFPGYMFARMAGGDTDYGNNERGVYGFSPIPTPPSSPEASDDESDGSSSASAHSSRTDSPQGATGTSPDLHQLRRLSVVGTPPPPTLITPDEDADKNPQCREAWRLGDIEPSGNNDSQGQPIWQIRSHPEYCFTNGAGDITAPSDPPTVYHEANQVHCDMWCCLYGVWSNVDGFPSSVSARCFEMGFDERYGPR